MARRPASWQAEHAALGVVRAARAICSVLPTLRPRFRPHSPAHPAPLPTEKSPPVLPPQTAGSPGAAIFRQGSYAIIFGVGGRHVAGLSSCGAIVRYSGCAERTRVWHRISGGEFDPAR